jgi:hypothetical protein
MSILSWCQWLQNTSWATGIRQSDLLFPFIEGSHILALGLSVGLIVIFDLRLLRLAFSGEPVSRIMRQVMPWVRPGFAVVMLTGILLFAAHAEKVYTNMFFRFKFLFLFLAGINALFYQVKYYPKIAEWDLAPAVPTGAKLTAIFSLLLWAAVIAMGRTMAYEL